MPAAGWNIWIAALDADVATAQRLCDHIEEAWGDSERPTFSSVALSEIASHADSSVDALILLAPAHAPQSVVLGPLTAVDEAGIPMLALLDCQAPPDNIFRFAGALTMLRDEPAPRIAAILLGLAHAHRQARRLRDEASLTERFQGGIRGEINKMHEELQLAAAVQREFLPREIPSLHGISLDALWRPSNYVSGDIYDIARLDDDHIGVFVADSVGHGVPAALMTMVISRALVTRETTAQGARLLSPSEVLSRLNTELIRRQGATTRFVTAVYALIDCRSRVMQLAGAGHPPPIRLAAQTSHTSPGAPDTSEVTGELLDTEGGLLGVFADETYPQRKIELSAGDRILFYTDGFEQAFPSCAENAHQRKLPSDRYRAEFDRLGSLAGLDEPKDAIEEIGRRLDDQKGSLHQADDLTLICMHVGELAQQETSLECTRASVTDA